MKLIRHWDLSERDQPDVVIYHDGRNYVVARIGYWNSPEQYWDNESWRSYHYERSDALRNAGCRITRGYLGLDCCEPHTEQVFTSHTDES